MTTDEVAATLKEITHLRPINQIGKRHHIKTILLKII